MRNIGLGDRMKQYEQVTQVRLIRRMPVILRLDGKSFHRFTRGFKKPFDPVMLTAMQKTPCRSFATVWRAVCWVTRSLTRSLSCCVIISSWTQRHGSATSCKSFAVFLQASAPLPFRNNFGRQLPLWDTPTI